VDAVLSAIVRRVRQLLGADLGYLSLIDVERGDCYMRITEGSQSPAFPTLRLPLGSGVVGRARSGVRPPKPVTCRYLSRRPGPGGVEAEPAEADVRGDV
jgi:signal transduction protein with GAF and PtsI domain